MVAQETVSFAPALAALTAALVVAGPVSVAVTKIVDFVRNLVDAPDRLPKWLWGGLALLVGLVLALGWDINLLGGLIQAVPALADSSLGDGVVGNVLTGLAIGGMASFWHEKMDQWSAAAKPEIVVTDDVVEPL